MGEAAKDPLDRLRELDSTRAWHLAAWPNPPTTAASKQAVPFFVIGGKGWSGPNLREEIRKRAKALADSFGDRAMPGVVVVQLDPPAMGLCLPVAPVSGERYVYNNTGVVWPDEYRGSTLATIWAFLCAKRGTSSSLPSNGTATFWRPRPQRPWPTRWSRKQWRKQKRLDEGRAIPAIPE